MKCKIFEDELYPYYGLIEENESCYKYNDEAPELELDPQLVQKYQEATKEFFKYQHILHEIIRTHYGRKK